jgi:hypothetical protein
MSENVLIPLPGFTLPIDFPWRIRFIAAVEEQLRFLRSSGHFLPPRFFGYYFQGNRPVGVSGRWTVALDAEPALLRLPTALERLTHGHFSICCEAGEDEPDFLLVHDRLDGGCWLWRFAYGMRFVEATEPVEIDGVNGLGNRKLLGP